MPSDDVARAARILARLNTSGRIVPTHPAHAMWTRVWSGLVDDVAAALEREERPRPIEERRQRYRAALARLGYSRAQTLAAAYGQPVDWRRPRGEHRAHSVRVPRPRPRAHSARRPSGAARRPAARAPASDPASPSRADLAAQVRVLEAALAVLELLDAGGTA